MDNIYNQKKRCIYCGEEIDENAGRCPTCGSLADKSVIDGIEEKINDSNTVVLDEIPQNIEKQVKNYSPNVSNTNIPENQPYQPKSKLSNGLKVFLTALSVAVPFLGQIAGIIIAIVYMNTSDDEDKKSFGTALLVVSLVFFILSFLGIITIGMIALVFNSIPN